MREFKDSEPFEDTSDLGLRQAVERAHQAYLKTPRIKAVADRANEAMKDYLDTIPGSLYRIMKEDIGRVWGLLESPIEQVAIIQFASENYGREDWPIYAKVARARGQYDHKNYPVQIIPQVEFGRYRVDFLFDLGGRGLFAIECDGKDFHQDRDRDERRDDVLRKEHGVKTLRIQGKEIWRDNGAVSSYADLIRVYLK